MYVQNCPANALTARKACVVNYIAGATEWSYDQAKPLNASPKDLYNLGVYGGGFTDLVCSQDCAANGKGNPGPREWYVPARAKTNASSGCCYNSCC